MNCLKRDDVVLATILKNASTTLARLFAGDLIQPDEIRDERVICFIRHPLDRLVSAYHELAGHWKVRANSFSEFLGFSLSWDNDHVLPQTELLQRLPRATLFPVDMLYGLHRERASKRKPWPDYFTPEFQKRALVRYQPDLSLYEIVRAEGFVKYIN